MAAAELSLLGLIDDSNIQRLLESLIDLPTFAELRQKKIAEATAGSNISAG